MPRSTFHLVRVPLGPCFFSLNQMVTFSLQFSLPALKLRQGRVSEVLDAATARSLAILVHRSAVSKTGKGVEMLSGPRPGRGHEAPICRN